jgi:hypothetical protein
VGATVLRDRLTLVVDVGVSSPNTYMREHYLHRSTRRKRERSAVLSALKPYEAPTEPAPALVTFTRFASRSLDDDNLSAAFKAPRDAVAGWLGQSDAADSLISWRYAQVQERDPQVTKTGKTKHRVWFQLDISWDVSEPAPAPPERDLEAVQVPGLDPRVRCHRVIPWETATGEVLARLPHVKPEHGGGSELVVARKNYKGTTYLHACVHFSTGGRRYRTLGVALFTEDELLALRDACDQMLEAM